MEELIGARVDSVEFGVAYLQLRLNRSDAVFSVGTNAAVSCDTRGGNPADFRDTKDGTGLVDLLDAQLIEFVVLEPGRAASLRFDEDREVKAWWPDAADDNLFIVRRENSEDWWVVE